MSSEVAGSKGNNQHPPPAHHGPGTGPRSTSGAGRPDHGRPIGERGNAVTVADQHVARMYPEGAIHQVPAPTKVRQHGVDPLVVTRDRVAARDVPADIVGKQRRTGALSPPA